MLSSEISGRQEREQKIAFYEHTSLQAHQRTISFLLWSINCFCFAHGTRHTASLSPAYERTNCPLLRWVLEEAISMLLSFLLYLSFSPSPLELELLTINYKPSTINCFVLVFVLPRLMAHGSRRMVASSSLYRLKVLAKPIVSIRV